MPSETQFQNTLAKSASLTGTALHTGEKVTLTLHPAPPGTGRKFRRSDLPDEPTIDASIENVKTVERATTIAEGSVKVQTVEHVLAALAGLEVDNCHHRDGRQRAAHRRRQRGGVCGPREARRHRRAGVRTAPQYGVHEPSNWRRNPARS